LARPVRDRPRLRRRLWLGMAAPAANFIGCDRLGEALQVELADRRGLDVRLDRAEGALADDHLAWPCLVAQSPRQIDDAADRGVFAPLLETDLPERGIAGGDSDAEAQGVA